MTHPSGAQLKAPPPSPARREHQPLAVSLLGRYRLATRQDYPCLGVEISLAELSILAPVRPPVGERVIVHLEELGTLEGPVVRHTMWGFVLTLSGTLAKREKLAAQLAWLEDRQALGLLSKRRHPRIVPLSTAVLVRFENGREVATRLIDVSRSGAALRLEPRPPVGSLLTLGRTPGRVVRHLDGGVAVEFLSIIERARFSEAIIL
jgi:hypothetical protein